MLPIPPTTLDAVIDLTDWERDADFEYHPIGSKPKRVCRCPDPAGHPLLIAGHAYLFKVAHGWQAGQMWSEAIAHRIGAAIGLDVPACFVAVDRTTGETGALVEFFVGYPGDERPERLVHGADLLQGRGFTAGADRPHNLFTNVEVSDAFGVPDAASWWADLVAFDALIGNTDRHTENWGVLVGPDDRRRMAPLFDNGTSLGYMLPDGKLSGMRGGALDAFIGRGTHL